MASKNLSDKELKTMQEAHTKFREETGAKLVVASKVKEYCKALGRRSEAGLEDELADILYKALWKAVSRCDGNNRTTVKSVDI